jgi:predicted transcriptional regulator
MTIKVKTIEIDAATAEALEAHAAKQGVTVSELIAELMSVRQAEFVDADLAELDRRWQAVEARQDTVPHDKVIKWLESWGTPAFRPWPNP